MDATRLILIIACAIIAFRAGFAWRHHKRTWADYKTVATSMKTLKKTRWKVLREGVLAVAILVVFIGLITFGTNLRPPGQPNQTKTTPASVNRVAHTTTPSPHKASPSPRRTH